ncbi:MAG: glycosyltransferase family 2 protein [Bdellovibrionaceae bacterium]|nr:glycosyltransferase family 2 protein [Pseudobdellovibrionaceae bacterium]
MKPYQVTAIITCFFPKEQDLARLVDSIKDQVSHLIIINNGGLEHTFIPASPASPSNEKLIILEPKANLGTAGGYNLGAKKAWDLGSTHILLLDQDSECHRNMVAELLELESYLISQGKAVAVVGPYYLCKSNNQVAPFIQHEGYRIRRIYETSPEVISFISENTPQSPKKFVSCSYLISSGSLISKASWMAIKETNEGLFLDFTDIEWGLRATHLNYECFGSFNAKMFHLIGDDQISVLGRKISLHSPLRHYYAFRNCVWLFQQDYVAFSTRVNYLVKLIPKLMIYSLFSNQPWKQIKFMLLGIFHGLLNKMGRYDG